MKKEITISAKTLDEAITKGCEELGVGLEDVDFEVVDEGGMFRKMQVKIGVKGSATDDTAPADNTPTDNTPTVEVESGSVEEFEIIGQGKPQRTENAETPRIITEFDEKCPKFVQTLDFATKFFGLMNDQLQITTSHDDHEFLISVSGEDVSRLIGKEGKTLAAINTIIASIGANTHSGEPRRVMVDIENYREKRKESLINLAKKKAEYVKRTGKSVRLEPMPARERVIVHTTLQDFEGITTQSEGVEPRRYLIIKPGAR